MPRHARALLWLFAVPLGLATVPAALWLVGAEWLLGYQPGGSKPLFLSLGLAHGAALSALLVGVPTLLICIRFQGMPRVGLVLLASLIFCGSEIAIHVALGSPFLGSIPGAVLAYTGVAGAVATQFQSADRSPTPAVQQVVAADTGTR